MKLSITVGSHTESVSQVERLKKKKRGDTSKSYSGLFRHKVTKKYAPEMTQCFEQIMA